MTRRERVDRRKPVRFESAALRLPVSRENVSRKSVRCEPDPGGGVPGRQRPFVGRLTTCAWPEQAARQPVGRDVGESKTSNRWQQGLPTGRLGSQRRRRPATKVLFEGCSGQRRLLLREASGSETDGQPASIFLLAVQEVLLEVCGGNVWYEFHQLRYQFPCLIGLAAEAV